MKMPDKINPSMLAPCGINCMVCYKHCYSKNPCAGCYVSDVGKPNHCRECKIKNCAIENKVTYCFECSTFPCKLIKNIEKSYNKRYHVSLVRNSLTLLERGIENFMETERERWTCSFCGGVVSLHDAECSECKQTISFT